MNSNACKVGINEHTVQTSLRVSGRALPVRRSVGPTLGNRSRRADVRRDAIKAPESRNFLKFADGFRRKKAEASSESDDESGTDEPTFAQRMLSGDQVMATYLSGRLRQASHAFSAILRPQLPFVATSLQASIMPRSLLIRLICTPVVPHGDLTFGECLR